MIEPGFYDVPPGMVATVVTHLEMHDRPSPRAFPDQGTLKVIHQERPTCDWYRSLFRKVGGEDWLWFSRLAMSDEELSVIIRADTTKIWSVRDNDQDLGLLELDFQGDECELAFFGLSSELQGRGTGRMLMEFALDQAFSHNIKRFHVHTCTLDSPQALGFYVRSGFTPIRQQVEIAPDPRLQGHLPLTAAPQIPIFK
jgi:ribosomal protein S18 acetylase RimI-like enzyme